MNQRAKVSAMSDHKIQVQNINKTFVLGNERFEALGDVSLKVDENEFITVVGPSGCGKSTLMNILAGLDEPTGGAARSEEHTSELQSRGHLVCRLTLEKKKIEHP